MNTDEFMQQSTTLISEIGAFLFGRRYYANIINIKGTVRCEISCYIFCSKAEAARHREGLEGNMSYKFVETISFRSRRDYFNLTSLTR